MAMTYVETKKTVMGDLKCSVYEITLTGVTSGYIKTGYSNILIAHHNNETTEADGKIKKNIATDGSTVEFGGLYLVGFTSNDVVTVQVLAD